MQESWFPPTAWGSFVLTSIWVPFMCLIQGVRVAHIIINLSYQQFVFIMQIYSGSNRSDCYWWMCVYLGITKWPIYYRKGKENYWDLLLSASCFALWFSLDFCNNSEMKIVLSIMISGLRFFPIFFLLNMYSLLTPKENSPSFKMQGRCWGVQTSNTVGFLIQRERDGGWAILEKCWREHPSTLKVEWKPGPDESKLKYGWCFQRSRE